MWRRPCGDQLYFLHTRLSIIDLDSRADQPFHDEKKWLIYNGELYNYLELRQGSYRTRSDTEVLARHLRLEGEDALDRFEGMWAFALYDEADGTLTLSRDRFGEKPLYLFEDETGLYFASELKVIAALRGPLSPNINHVLRYMVNGYKSLYKTRETFFEGVSELEPGTCLRIDLERKATSRRYWSPSYRPDETLSYEDAVAGARRELIRAVGQRLRADVPLAFCMSGGVDSNALIAIAKKEFDFDVHGFTIRSADERYDEHEIVLSVVKELNLRHTMIMADTNDFLPRLRALVRRHDAPVATITYYAHWLIEQSVAAHGYKISLSGTGADELFSGYYDHHLAYLYDIHEDRRLFETSLRAWEKEIKPYVRNPFLSDPYLFIKDRTFRGHIFLDSEKFAGYLTRPWSEPFREELYCGESLLRNRMLNELRHESVPVILREDDLNAMSFSIENRSPFLDRGLCDFCFTVPTRHLVRNGVAKAILRDAMKGIVPKPVLRSSRKVGFNLPIRACLDADNPDIRNEILAPSPIYDHVRRDMIEALLKRRDLPNSESKFLFYFLNAKCFLEEFAA